MSEPPQQPPPQQPYGQPPYQYPPQPPYGQQPYGYGYGYGGYPPPPQWTPPPRIDPQLIKPSRLWYWLSAIPAVVGTVIAVVLLVEIIGQFDFDLDRMRTPQPVTVSMDKDDEKGIYLQTSGDPAARSASAATLSCRVRDARERPVPLKDASGFTLTVNEDEFVEQWRFVAPADGRYTVTCGAPEGVPAAVGPHVAVRRFWAPLVGMIVAFLAGIAIAVTMAVVTGVKRSNHKSRLQREAREATG